MKNKTKEMTETKECPRCKKYSLVPSGKINDGKNIVYYCIRCGYREIRNQKQ